MEMAAPTPSTTRRIEKVKLLRSSVVSFAKTKPTAASTDNSPNCGVMPEDPDDLINLGEAVQLAFDRLADEAADHVMGNVFREMAEMYRRANDDVSRRWRDVTG